jgi:hypothetical protein
MCSIVGEFQIFDPIKISDSMYYSKVMHKESEINFQVSKTQLILKKSKNGATIILDENSAAFIKQVSECVIKNTSQNSTKFFGKQISREDCETIYKETLTPDNKLHCFIDENTYFYESKNKEIKHEDLLDEFNGIAIVKGGVVVYTKTSFFIKWEISQFKIKRMKEQPEEEEMITEYIIKDLPEHSKPLDDEKLEKKLVQISLF